MTMAMEGRPESPGIVRSRPESFGVVQSRPESKSSGVVGVVPSRPESFRIGVGRSQQEPIIHSIRSPIVAVIHEKLMSMVIPLPAESMV